MSLYGLTRIERSNSAYAIFAYWGVIDSSVPTSMVPKYYQGSAKLSANTKLDLRYHGDTSHVATWIACLPISSCVTAAIILIRSSFCESPPLSKQRQIPGNKNPETIEELRNSENKCSRHWARRLEIGKVNSAGITASVITAN